MKKIYTIGRDEGCDIVVPDSTDVISRLHATVRVESNGKIFLTDQSKNGTYVNGMKMSSNVEIPVSRKDVVSFAHIYNLDWALVPKPQSPLLKIFWILLAVLALAGMAGYVMSVRKDKFQKPVEENLVPIVKKDTVVVRDTVLVEPKIKNKSNPVKPKISKDSTTVEKTTETVEERIYNPIY